MVEYNLAKVKVEGSNPSASVEPVKIDPPASAPDPSIRYRLALYDREGQIRSDIPRGIVYEVGALWGDIIRQIPTNKGATIDEIVESVWNYEKRHKFRTAPDRTRKQIEDAVAGLLEKRVIQPI